jgi:23S rRNA pseudouridine2605 synthase
MRLAKFLAHAGVASRRAAEEIIRAGRVTVGGVQVTDPAHDVDPEALVEIDGDSTQIDATRVVYALNKPAGVVSTASDPQRRTTVVSLIRSDTRLYPIGRLDIDATGLILLTNDGALAHRLTHPSFEVEKTYRVLVAKPPVRDHTIRALRAGVELDDGRTAPARVRRLAPDTLEITIHEGRKRQIKRMCEHAGHPVRRLERVRFGPLELGELRRGSFRRLTDAEIARLQRAASAGRGARRAAASSRSEPVPRRDGSASRGARRRASSQ